MATPHTPLLVAHWMGYQRLLTQLADGSSPLALTIDGASLTLADVIAASKYPTSVTVEDACLDKCAASAERLSESLRTGQRVYAANTGIGGSGAARPAGPEALQQALIRMLTCGVLTSRASDGRGQVTKGLSASFVEDGDPSSLPTAWVRASILLRVNSLAPGYSAVRPVVLHRLIELLNRNTLPRTPLRGSISASGDLIPLSYLAAAMIQHPGIQMESTNEKPAQSPNPSADSFRFAPREAVALVNGTATSTAAAAEALHRAHLAAALAQILTAMNLESLKGSLESFSTFVMNVRPHVGQIEAARNIRGFLHGSQMLRETVSIENDGDSDGEDGAYPTDPGQDRYALRTAAQWIGPPLSSLALAHTHVTTEINSVTDNPLLQPADSDGKKAGFVQGGNFQSSPVAAAMDMVRSALHSMGRILFQQLTEMMHPPTSRGLPPNLTAAVEPSADFLFKCADVAAASYVSELAFLERSVGPCVQVAEQGNQSVNALALLSARLTTQALDVFEQLTATGLVAACQALDLRTLSLSFAEDFKPSFVKDTLEMLHSLSPNDIRTDSNDQLGLAHRLYSRFLRRVAVRLHQDVRTRFHGAMEHAAVALYAVVAPGFETVLAEWKQRQSAAAEALFLDILASHRPEHTQRRVGKAARRLHRHLRETLRIPFLRGEDDGCGFRDEPPDVTLGTYITRVYLDMRNDGLWVPIMEAMQDANANDAR